MSLFGLFRSPNVEKLEAKRDVQGLIKALGYQKRDYVRQAAIEALRKIGAPAVGPLILALKDRNVYEAATETLSKIGPPAVDPLIVALGDPAIDVRKAAAEALGKSGDTRAVEPLTAALKDKSWQVNEAAAKALKSLGRPEAERALAEYQASRSAVGAQSKAQPSTTPSPPSTHPDEDPYRAGLDIVRNAVRESRDQSPHPDEDPIETHYRKMARTLMIQYGCLKRVEYLSHFPNFEINFLFERETVYSGRRQGEYDIHFLSLGYVGEGPRYARVLLDELGFQLSSIEIEKIRPGAVIERSDTTVTIRYPHNSKAQAAHDTDTRTRALFQAIVRGDASEVNSILLQGGIDLDEIHRYEFTPGYEGLSALSLAASTGHRERVKCLLNAGADVNAVDASSGVTALYEAADKGYLGIAEDLIATSARLDVGRYPWEGSELWGQPALVELLLKSGADVNRADKDGWTPLHSAVWKRYPPELEVVRKLLEAGANPNAKDTYDNSPLHRAALHDQYEAVQILLDAGADPRMRNDEGKWPGDCTQDPQLWSLLPREQIKVSSSRKPSGKYPHSFDSRGICSKCGMSQKFAGTIRLCDVE